MAPRLRRKVWTLHVVAFAASRARVRRRTRRGRCSKTIFSLTSYGNGCAPNHSCRHPLPPSFPASLQGHSCSRADTRSRTSPVLRSTHCAVRRRPSSPVAQQEIFGPSASASLPTMTRTSPSAPPTRNIYGLTSSGLSPRSTSHADSAPETSSVIGRPARHRLCPAWLTAASSTTNFDRPRVGLCAVSRGRKCPCFKQTLGSIQGSGSEESPLMRKTADGGTGQRDDPDSGSESRRKADEPT
jgi:hypothetical protein